MDEGLRSELSKQGIFTTTLGDLYNWGRKNSVWPLQFGLACCAIEMIATTMARYQRSADDVPDHLEIPKWSWSGLVDTA